MNHCNHHYAKYSSSSTWNDLPDDVTSAESLSAFHQRLKTHLFVKSFSDYSLHWTSLGERGEVTDKESLFSSTLYYLGHFKDPGLIDWLNNSRHDQRSTPRWDCVGATKVVIYSTYLQNVVAQYLHLHLVGAEALDVEIQLQLRLSSLEDNRHAWLHVRVQSSALRVVRKQLEHLVPHPRHLRLHRLHLQHCVVEVAVEKVEPSLMDVEELLQQSHSTQTSSRGTVKPCLSYNQSHRVHLLNWKTFSTIAVQHSNWAS